MEFLGAHTNLICMAIILLSNSNRASPCLWAAHPECWHKYVMSWNEDRPMQSHSTASVTMSPLAKIPAAFPLSWQDQQRQQSSLLLQTSVRIGDSLLLTLDQAAQGSRKERRAKRKEFGAPVLSYINFISPRDPQIGYTQKMEVF